jgi:alkaline phosphatase D
VSRSSRTTASVLLPILLVILAQCAKRPERPPAVPPPPPPAGALAQGVATGDVGSRSAIVWLRTQGAARAQVVWAPEADWKTDAADPGMPRSAVLTTDAEHDFTLQVPLADLSPGTAYRYDVLTGAGSEDSLTAGATGRFRTAPAPDVPERVTLLWSGDLGGQQFCRQERGYHIFERMLQEAPAFAVLLGDLIYGDDRCPAPPNAPGSDFLAATLAQYRAKHRYQRGDAALRRFLAAVPVYAMWDDHEVKNNFAGPHEPLMPVGRRALREYWPIATAPDDPHRLYRRVRRGADLELFLLDTRQYRDRNADPDRPGKTMLGDAQRKWLLDGLMASQATWKLVATSVPLSNAKPGGATAPGNDSWARGPDGTGFQSELRAIVGALMERGVRNVVWLAADVHFVQINAYDPDGNGTPDFHEFICGPLSARTGLPTTPDPALGAAVLYDGGGFLNFGKISIEGTTLRVQIIDETGTIRFERSFAAS